MADNRQLIVAGVLVKKGDPETREGKNGKKYTFSEFVINTGGMYPKDIAFTDMGDKCKLDGIVLHSYIDVYFSPSSREYKGKYYTQLVAYKAEVRSDIPEQVPPKQEEQKPQPAPQTQVQQQVASVDFSSEVSRDYDLPF